MLKMNRPNKIKILILAAFVLYAFLVVVYYYALRMKQYMIYTSESIERINEQLYSMDTQMLYIETQASRVGEESIVDNDSLRNFLIAKYPKLNDNNVGDFEKTSILRDWAYSVVISSAYENFMDYITEAPKGHPRLGYADNAYRLFRAFRNYEAKGPCSTSAYFLATIYDLFGYETGSLFTWMTSAGAHTVTFVKINPDTFDEKWILQDGFYNVTYADSTDCPIDLRQMIRLLAEGNDVEVQRVFGNNRYRLYEANVPPHLLWQDTLYAEPGTLNYCPFRSKTSFITGDTALYYIDARHPESLVADTEDAFDEYITPLGYPLRMEYVYLYTVTQSAANTNAESANSLFKDISEIQSQYQIESLYIFE